VTNKNKSTNLQNYFCMSYLYFLSPQHYFDALLFFANTVTFLFLVENEAKGIGLS